MMKIILLSILTVILALTNCKQVNLWDNLNSSETDSIKTSMQPTVETLTPGSTFLPLKNIVGTSFEAGGKILDEGTEPITDMGVCISEDDVDYTCSSADSTSGYMFKVTFTGKTPGKYYHMKAYADNGFELSYGDVITINSGYEIGTSVGGGLVIKNDGSGHGLIAHEDDQSIIIKASWTDAMNYCRDLTSRGFNDWHLPSIEQLLLINERLNSSGLVGFSNYKCWSSIEEFDNTPTSSYSVNFQTNSEELCDKAHEHYIIPIRYF